MGSLNRDERMLVMAVIAAILFIIVISSPIGTVIGQVLSVIPGAAWSWIFGLLALFFLVMVLRWFIRGGGR